MFYEGRCNVSVTFMCSGVVKRYYGCGIIYICCMGEILKNQTLTQASEVFFHTSSRHPKLSKIPRFLAPGNLSILGTKKNFRKLISFIFALRQRRCSPISSQSQIKYIFVSKHFLTDYLLIYGTVLHLETMFFGLKSTACTVGMMSEGIGGRSEKSKRWLN